MKYATVLSKKASCVCNSLIARTHVESFLTFGDCTGWLSCCRRPCRQKIKVSISAQTPNLPIFVSLDRGNVFETLFGVGLMEMERWKADWLLATSPRVAPIARPGLPGYTGFAKVTAISLQLYPALPNTVILESWLGSGAGLEQI